MATTTWPADVPVPETRPKMPFSGHGSGIPYILTRVRRAARAAGWTGNQLLAFEDVALSGDRGDLLRACAKYFEVSG